MASTIQVLFLISICIIILLIVKHTNGNHWDEVRILVLEGDEPPVTVVVALSGVAILWGKVIPRIPNLRA